MSLATTGAAASWTAGFNVDNTNLVETTTGVFTILSASAGASTGGLGVCTQIAQMSGMVALGATLAASSVSGINLVTGVTSTANMITVMTNYKYGCFALTNAAAVAIGGFTAAAGDVNKYVAYFRHT
ncbi:MAG: hypothetical protein WCJ64_24370 [Rhodospirillaceae bacterium]